MSTIISRRHLLSTGLAAIGATVVTAGYMLWALQRMYLGAPNPKYADKGWEINGRELVTLVPLAIVVLFLGVYPMAILRLPRIRSDRSLPLNPVGRKSTG